MGKNGCFSFWFKEVVGKSRCLLNLSQVESVACSALLPDEAAPTHNSITVIVGS